MDGRQVVHWGKKSGTTMMGSDAQKNMRMDRQRILDVKDDDGATALMILGQGNVDGIRREVCDGWVVWSVGMHVDALIPDSVCD